MFHPLRFDDAHSLIFGAVQSWTFQKGEHTYPLVI